VSDMSQGPGWWIASDDKWYPPESHPDVMASRVAKADSKRADAAAPAESDRPQSSSVGSTPSGESTQSSESNPTIESTPKIQSIPKIQSAPTVPPPVFNEGSSRRSVFPSDAPKRSKGPWVLGVVVIVGLAVAALVVALASGSGSSTFADGASAVAFQISAPGGGHPFSGMVGSKDLTGKIIEASALGSPQLGTNAIPLLIYEGHLGSTSYVLNVSIDEHQTTAQQEQVVFLVNGTYGSEPVKASASFKLGSLVGSSETVSFNGHVGSHPLHGVASATLQAGGGATITGTVNALPTP